MTQAMESNEAMSRRSAQDELIVEALASGRSYEQTAGVAGVSARTVARRMTDPEFAGLVAARRDERVAAITTRLTALGPEAVDVVRACMQDPDARPAERLRAASLALSLILRFRHLEELEREVAAIKSQLAAAGNEGPVQ